MRVRYAVPKRFWLNFADESGAGGGNSGDGGASGDGSQVAPTIEAGTTESQSQETNLDFEAARAAGEQKPAINWGEAVPEEYKDKPYIQNILKNENPSKQFFQEMDNLQKRLGERPAGIPKDDAPQEEKDRFYKALGRPDSPDDYVLEKPQWADEDKKVGEFIDSMRNEAYEKEMKQALFNQGLSAKQVAEIAKAQDSILLKHNKEFFQTTAAQSAAINADYVDVMKNAFGSRAAQVEEVGSKIVKDYTPENLKPLVAQLDNKGLAILSAVLDNVNTKFIKQDSFSQEFTSSFKNQSDARAEGQRLMASPEYTNVMHPNHEATVNKVNTIYKSLDKLAK